LATALCVAESADRENRFGEKFAKAFSRSRERITALEEFQSASSRQRPAEEFARTEIPQEIDGNTGLKPVRRTDSMSVFRSRDVLNWRRGREWSRREPSDIDEARKGELSGESESIEPAWRRKSRFLNRPASELEAGAGIEPANR